MKAYRFPIVGALASERDGSGLGVIFRVKKSVKYGEHVRLVGSSRYLGTWNVGRVKVTWCGVKGMFGRFQCLLKSVRRSLNGNVFPSQEVRQAEETESSIPAAPDMFEKPMSEKWSGDDIVFMQSNEHRRDRAGVWNTEGLEGAALAYVNGDRDAGSWLGKLELAKTIIVDKKVNMRPSIDTLAYSFVYLTWVSNGSIPCVDSGGHRRPNHHAKLSQLIFRSLEWVIGERQGTADALFARRMHTRIPSFTDEFMQSTPLTRIRDIAHRNDIPQDLKREIKHTIQNKLHRNAGPEDLAATEALLGRIMSKRDEYSADFISELQLFLKELRDFFNAGSLEDALLGLGPSLDEDANRLIGNFISAKKKVDSMSVWDDNTVMDCMHAVTTVRAVLSSGLSAGLRNDAPDRALVMRQKWRLSEIRAEDYIFMLLSRFINNLEDKGGSEYLKNANDGAWALPIGAIVLSLRHIGLSGYMQSECMALENELMTWQQMGGFAHQDEARRITSTLQRVLRLTESFSSMVVESLYAPATLLGSALGVQAEKAMVFSESEIRSNVAFQTSKLATLLLKGAMQAANMPPWQVICRGECTGTLVRVDELSPKSIESLSDVEGQVIAVVTSATGDEELVSLGDKLQGVVLLQDIPHLSHLGVRARQEKMVFIASDNTDVAQEVLQHMGSLVTLSATAENISIQYGSESTNSPSRQSNVPTCHPSNKGVQPVLAKQPCVIHLAEAELDTSGAKAMACKELLHVARECSGDTSSNGSTTFFYALDGLVIPYGSLEAVVDQNGLQRNGRKSWPFILDLKIPQTLAAMIEGVFKDADQVILRSSANVEDLEGLSGAGLYDSITNVPSTSHESIEKAIKQVWASLFSRRAVLARSSVGIQSRDAHMAVLIQPQVSPEISFVLHTNHPLLERSILAEIAPGQGEILASGTRGSGWRLSINTESISCDSFANFSNAFFPESSTNSTLVLKTMDYSRHELSCSSDARDNLGKRLGIIGTLLEKVFGCPQDIEGCIMNNQLYILQSRPQP
eukprot:jgi/Picre1/30641/NNA_006002.t1